MSQRLTRRLERLEKARLVASAHSVENQENLFALIEQDVAWFLKEGPLPKPRACPPGVEREQWDSRLRLGQALMAYGRDEGDQDLPGLSAGEIQLVKDYAAIIEEVAAISHQEDQEYALWEAEAQALGGLTGFLK